jgi:hypothetical protein
MVKVEKVGICVVSDEIATQRRLRFFRMMTTMTQNQASTERGETKTKDSSIRSIHSSIQSSASNKDHNEE